MAATMQQQSSFASFSFKRRSSISQIDPADPAQLPPVPPPTRRSSWIHSISQKLTPDSSKDPKEPRRSSVDSSSTSSTSVSELPQQKSNILSSAFRRLSTSSSSSKACGPHSCRRVVFNRNTDRPTCPLQELQTLRMKRVAFRVDELDDETLAKEPLYCQIRRALKYQRALELKQLEAQSVLDVKAAAAGLSGFTPGALPRKIPASAPTTPLKAAASAAPDPRPILKREASSESTPCAQANLLLDVPPSPTIQNGIPACEIDVPSAVISNSLPERRDSVISDSSGEQTCDPETRNPPVSPQQAKADCLGKIYARCCKLREQTPAPFIYRQLEGKHSLDTFTLAFDPASSASGTPLSYQQMQALADLFAFVPVDNFVIGGVSLSESMFREITSSLAKLRGLKSLSLQGTKLDCAGWKCVCYIVAMSPSLEHLDIRGMSRKNPDWDLLARAIEARQMPLKVDLEHTDIGETERLRIQTACEGLSSSAVATSDSKE
ncbi:hypothetical protein BZA70DRAFT_288671 [Myxozyma melibiosi]|uniref:Uncharacterized protein n=1 Tax=Myxozyma melibiosi TaxID=54550 RepID=A0ABR1F928_9ASCO